MTARTLGRSCTGRRARMCVRVATKCQSARHAPPSLLPPRALSLGETPHVVLASLRPYHQRPSPGQRDSAPLPGLCEREAMQGTMGYSVSATHKYQEARAHPPFARNDCCLLGKWPHAVEDGHELHGAKGLEPPPDDPCEAAKPGMARSCPTRDAILACTMACTTHLKPAGWPGSRRSSVDSAAAAL